jgi:hypothetical protein
MPLIHCFYSTLSLFVAVISHSRIPDSVSTYNSENKSKLDPVHVIGINHSSELRLNEAKCGHIYGTAASIITPVPREHSKPNGGHFDIILISTFQMKEQ